MNKALATDLDGTLFYPKRKLSLVDKANLNFLKRYLKTGRKLILVTGRNYSVSSRVIKKLEKYSSQISMICCNGAFKWVDGKIVDKKGIDHVHGKELYEFLSNDKGVATIMTMSDKVNMYLDPTGLNFPEKIVGIIGMKGQLAYSEPFVLGHKSALKMFDHDDECIYKIMPWYGYQKGKYDRALKASQELEKRFGEYFEIAWSQDAVEISHKGVNKAVALKEMMELLNLKEEEIIYVGDSGNDIPVFNEFTHSFVMKQAQDKVKEYATVIDSFPDLEPYCDIKGE